MMLYYITKFGVIITQYIGHQEMSIPRTEENRYAGTSPDGQHKQRCVISFIDDGMVP